MSTTINEDVSNSSLYNLLERKINDTPPEQFQLREPEKKDERVPASSTVWNFIGEYTVKLGEYHVLLRHEFSPYCSTAPGRQHTLEVTREGTTIASFIEDTRDKQEPRRYNIEELYNRTQQRITQGRTETEEKKLKQEQERQQQALKQERLELAHFLEK